ncbi:hypothetical protein [Streptomyces sp. CB01881]|uniref:hypothetical protein n=1 Tax=Streptomyces sp. CB01881 TaxID=2078691 RepID=UPI000CDCA777|nr:hypothetical protein [Streptomyces sp. CB01881]AUY53767.1 hypothetical protein C2142_38645 [Streptomyces sp. CB01881]TYC68777.1 hypothetical protein EH183_38640 [Streptomyces sp. CB01881]
MEFPARKALAGLGSAEYEALVSLREAVSTLDVELRSALAAEDRARVWEANAERRAQETRFAFEVEAFRGLASAAVRCADELEVLLWRYASAFTVLGISILERLAAGGPPLSEAVVGRLCEEPTLAEFERAVAVPVDGLLNREEEHLKLYREERRKLLDLVETAYECLGDAAIEDRMDRAAAAGARLSVDHPTYMDRPWIGHLDSLVALAQQTPNEISRVLKT